jgi:CMP-N-acetylneuraminic acid synthetase
MLIAGKPLIAYTIEAALKARFLGRVIVSTDDESIALVAKRHGAEVIMRPEALARDVSPIDDAYRHVLERLEEGKGFKPSVVVGMQANVPVRKNGEIDLVVERLLNTPWATAVATAYRIKERPEWMKRVKNQSTMEIQPFADPGTNYRMQDLPDLYLIDGGTIAVRAEVLKRTDGDRRVHAYMGDHVVIMEHERRFAVEIDDHEDVDLAEFFLSHGIRK